MLGKDPQIELFEKASAASTGEVCCLCGLVSGNPGRSAGVKSKAPGHRARANFQVPRFLWRGGEGEATIGSWTSGSRPTAAPRRPTSLCCQPCPFPQSRLGFLPFPAARVWSKEIDLEFPPISRSREGMRDLDAALPKGGFYFRGLRPTTHLRFVKRAPRDGARLQCSPQEAVFRFDRRTHNHYAALRQGLEVGQDDIMDLLNLLQRASFELISINRAVGSHGRMRPPAGIRYIRGLLMSPQSQPSTRSGMVIPLTGKMARASWAFISTRWFS